MKTGASDNVHSTTRHQVLPGLFEAYKNIESNTILNSTRGELPLYIPLSPLIGKMNKDGLLEDKSAGQIDPLFVVNGSTYVHSTDEGYALFPSSNDAAAEQKQHHKHKHKHHKHKDSKKDEHQKADKSETTNNDIDTNLMSVRSGQDNDNENKGSFLFVVKRCKTSYVLKKVESNEKIQSRPAKLSLPSLSTFVYHCIIFIGRSATTS